MTIQQAINNAKALTGQVVENATLVRWLSELDGRLAFEFYRADVWMPYDPVNDLNAELLVPFPWDGLYVHHLEAMTYFSDAEYDRYENARTMGEKTLADFRAFMQRTSAPLCGGGFPTEKTGGTGATIIPALTESPWFWISAYSIAVKHGYSGTEAEFAAMMEEANETASEAKTIAENANVLILEYDEDAVINDEKAAVDEAVANGRPVYVKMRMPNIDSPRDIYLPLLVAHAKETYEWQDNIYEFAGVAETSDNDIRFIRLGIAKGYNDEYYWALNQITPISNPNLPNGAGTYVLKATRATAGAAPTYEWVTEE